MWANQPNVRAPAIGDALQRARLHAAEPECPFRDHDAQRERAARQALAIGAVARIDRFRSLMGQWAAARFERFRRLGCLRSLRAHLALDGVSWVQSGSVEIAVGQ
jgi:aminoglycoside phosphotransferase